MAMAFYFIGDLEGFLFVTEKPQQARHRRERKKKTGIPEKYHGHVKK